ncbi:unnamed protein product [Allacma fusca]|uniref:Uncharacterized protein n=1 Tax=Allacma fusca TaxID=39272 RepID=A0A8J2KHT9_9HEXA|nr:unnamed protein product [Allacma fusca]
MSKTNSLERNRTFRISEPAASESDRDSGKGTLLDELRSQGDGSPLPSGIWSNGTRTPETQDLAGTPIENDVLQTQTPSSRKSSSEQAKSKFPQRTFKVILAGDAAVGKTTFIERVCNGVFVSNLSSTIGVDFRVKTIELDDKCIALQLWDTAGQERFRSLTKSYFRRADGVILMYDVTNERTFVSIRQWIQNVEESAGKKIPIILCGNKIDLREELYKGATCVNKEDGKKLARQCGAFFIETSPKTGYNVDTALLLLGREMSSMEDAELLNSMSLVKEDEGTVKKKNCCGGSSKEK